LSMNNTQRQSKLVRFTIYTLSSRLEANELVECEEKLKEWVIRDEDGNEGPADTIKTPLGWFVPPSRVPNSGDCYKRTVDITTRQMLDFVEDGEKAAKKQAEKAQKMESRPLKRKRSTSWVPNPAEAPSTKAKKYLDAMIYCQEQREKGKDAGEDNDANNADD